MQYNSAEQYNAPMPYSGSSPCGYNNVNAYNNGNAYNAATCPAAGGLILSVLPGLIICTGHTVGLEVKKGSSGGGDRVWRHPWFKPALSFSIPDRTVREIIKTTEKVIDERKTRDEAAEKRNIEELLLSAEIADYEGQIELIRLLIEFEYQRYEQELEDIAVVMMLFEM